MTNDERITNLSATVRSLADLCAKLQEENEDLKMQIDDYQTDYVIMESNIDELDNEVSTLRGELDRVRTERDRLKRDFLLSQLGGGKNEH